jgi:hypothetical protein
MRLSRYWPMRLRIVAHDKPLNGRQFVVELNAKLP